MQLPGFEGGREWNMEERIMERMGRGREGEGKERERREWKWREEINRDEWGIREE